MLMKVDLVCIFSGLYTIFMLTGIQSQRYKVRNIRNQKSGNVQQYQLWPGYFHICEGTDGLCTCYSGRARCVKHGEDLQYIPRLPRNTTDLYFCYNFLPVIHSGTFQNISHLKLESLSLIGNRIISLTSDAFIDLIFLKRLNLGINPTLNAGEVAKAFISLNKNTIGSIHLNEMGWTVIPSNIFANLYNSNLKIVDLSSNQLQSLDVAVFSGLKYLYILELENNKLSNLKMSRIDNLEDLELYHNRLYDIPDFCNNSDISETSYFPILTVLNLNFNQIQQLSEESFQCLPLLNRLTLKGNPLTAIQDNFISQLKLLNYLDISEIISANLLLFDFAFNNTSPFQLTFEKINLQSSIYFPRSAFKYCPNLTELSLSHTELPTDNKILYSLLSPLTHVQKLVLSSTGVTNLPHGVFSKMRSLAYLDLSENRISSWDGEKVFGNSSITTLLLNKNLISAINKTSIPSAMLESGKMAVDLTDNPYLCSCETLESVNWFRKHADFLYHYPEKYKCNAPKNLKETLLQNYNPSPESCAERNIALLVSLPVSMIAIATMSVIFLVYKCRWRLRYGIYLFKNRHNNYENIEGSDDLVYAGFVIYADDDRSWVHNELIHRMEDQEGFRLCIRLRDFDVGKVHVDNIVDNMFLSEKIIVILSNNFAKDEWCHFQLMLAETRLLKQNTDMLVIFMLEEIRSDCLRTSLYKLVTDRQYALWSNDGTGNNLFWEQAISQMKRSTVIH